MVNDPTPLPPGDFWPEWLKPRRLYEFGQNVLRLEGNVGTLRQQVSELQDNVRILQTQVEVLTAENRMLSQFLQASIARGQQPSRPQDATPTVSNDET